MFPYVDLTMVCFFYAWVMAHNQCYQNPTGFEKTHQLDQFKSFTESNLALKPFLAGSIQNWLVSRLNWLVLYKPPWFSPNWPVPYKTNRFYTENAKDPQKQLISNYFNKIKNRVLMLAI